MEIRKVRKTFFQLPELMYLAKLQMETLFFLPHTSHMTNNGMQLLGKRRRQEVVGDDGGHVF